jgi:hypothetical protein
MTKNIKILFQEEWPLEGYRLSPSSWNAAADADADADDDLFQVSRDDQVPVLIKPFFLRRGKNKLECLYLASLFRRESLLKGKGQYGCPPCTNQFRTAPF